LTYFTIILVSGVALFFVLGKRVMRLVQRMAKQNGEAKTSASVLAWYLFVLVAGAGCGIVAARWYWNTAQLSAFGYAFLVPMFIALVAFSFGGALGAGVLTLIGRRYSNGGRLAIGVATLVVLFMALVQPIQREVARGRQQQAATDIAEYQSKMASVDAKMAGMPHAQPNVVPPMLSVRREAGMVYVTNHAQDYLVVRVSLVLHKDSYVERCAIGVEAPISAGMTSYNMMVYVGPEQTRNYVTTICDPRFSAAPIEFVVWDPRADRELFKSDTAFLPDPPKPLR
jgi:hypothetical protein